MQAKEGGGEMGCAIGRQMILLLRLGGEEVTLQSQLRSSLDQTLCRVNAALRSSGRSRFWGYAVSLMHHRANKAGAEPAAPRAVTSEGTLQGPYRVSWPSLDGHACTRGSCLLVRVELWGWSSWCCGSDIYHSSIGGDSAEGWTTSGSHGVPQRGYRIEYGCQHSQALRPHLSQHLHF